MQFATEPHLTWEMIAAALDAGAEAPRVTGDEAYGQDTQLRAALETRRTGYALAVARSVRVRINSGRTPIRTDMVADRLPDAARHRQSVGNGVKGPRYYDRAWIHIGTDEHRHPLIRRNSGAGAVPNCFLATSEPQDDAPECAIPCVRRHRVVRERIDDRAVCERGEKKDEDDEDRSLDGRQNPAEHEQGKTHSPVLIVDGEPGNRRCASCAVMRSSCKLP